MYAESDGQNLALFESLGEILKQVNKGINPSMLAKFPNLLDAQFSYCKSKIDQDHSYDMSVASAAFSHFFSLLINAEKTLDHMLRLKCQNQPVDFMEPFVTACLGMFQHFFEQASVILETQNLLYYQILLVYMQIGNLIHKVTSLHSDLRIFAAQRRY